MVYQVNLSLHARNIMRKRKRNPQTGQSICGVVKLTVINRGEPDLIV
jgi:hypothetical protein